MFINIDRTLYPFLLLSTIVSTSGLHNIKVIAETVHPSTHPNSQATTAAQIKSKTTTFRGKLIYEEAPAVMSVRAYKHEEFLLITNSKKPARLVLRPSTKVSYNKLKSFHNQTVEITAVYVKGTRPSPSTACPVDMNGRCLLQGEGYQVLAIKSIR